MEYHLDKCVVLTVMWKHNSLDANYTLHGHQWEIVDNATYLGVEIPHNL